jgi:hypothetical protein
MSNQDALREQAEIVISILENHLIAWKPSRDEQRSLRMCIQRLERGLNGKRDTDPSRTLADWLIEGRG